MEISSEYIIQLLQSNSYRVRLENKIVKGPLFISPALLRNKIELLNLKFENTVEISIEYPYNYLIDFSGSVFKEGLNIRVHSEGEVKINLSHCEFFNDLELNSFNEKLELSLNKCKAHKSVNLANCSFKKLDCNQFAFINNEDKNHFLLEGTTIHLEALFNKSYLGIATFDGSIFKTPAKFDDTKFDSATFYNTEFECDIYCNRSEFGTHAFFNGAKFKKMQYFLYVIHTVQSA